MTDVADPEHDAPSRGDARRAAIREAAVEQFFARGYAATSMANIAEAAGVSRPAVYQYFADKEDVFASAFTAVFERRSADALAAFDDAADIGAALDAMLQRHDGDLWEMAEASPHYDEIAAAKTETVAAAIYVELDRFWGEIADRLATAHPGSGRERTERRAGWLDVLRWSPQGMRFDQPSIEEYRRRLSALARSVAADIESAT